MLRQEPLRMWHFSHKYWWVELLHHTDRPTDRALCKRPLSCAAQVDAFVLASIAKIHSLLLRPTTMSCVIPRLTLHNISTTTGSHQSDWFRVQESQPWKYCIDLCLDVPRSNTDRRHANGNNRQRPYTSAHQVPPFGLTKCVTLYMWIGPVTLLIYPPVYPSFVVYLPEDDHLVGRNM